MNYTGRVKVLFFKQNEFHVLNCVSVTAQAAYADAGGQLIQDGHNVCRGKDGKIAADERVKVVLAQLADNVKLLADRIEIIERQHIRMAKLVKNQDLAIDAPRRKPVTDRHALDRNRTRRHLAFASWTRFMLSKEERNQHFQYHT